MSGHPIGGYEENLAANGRVANSYPLVSCFDSHEGPVWQVAWAHPKFGPILASSSYDGKVFIWKDSGSGSTGQQQGGYQSGPYGQSSYGSTGGWTKIKEHAMHSASGE